MDIESKFLEGFNSHQKNITISGFGQAVRSGTFSKRDNGLLVEGSVATTIVHATQAFGQTINVTPNWTKMAIDKLYFTRTV